MICLDFEFVSNVSNNFKKYLAFLNIAVHVINLKMNNYCNEERIFMVKTFYSGVSLRRVRDLFAVNFDNRPIPSLSTIQHYVQKFERSGNISVESESRGGK